jgi:Fe2+ transport system protein FeoA
MEYTPGGRACREHGCPLAFGACRTRHCPGCGYTVPDEGASVLARWVRRLFGQAPAATDDAVGAAFPGDAAPLGGPTRPRTLADLRTGEEAVVARVTGDASIAITGHGLVPGLRVRLVQRVPSYVVELGETTLALERSVAAQVELRA